MVGRHHRLDEHKFEQATGVGDGQGHTINAGKGVEKRERSCTVGGNVNFFFFFFCGNVN